jgi:hypothetical protein
MMPIFVFKLTFFIMRKIFLTAVVLMSVALGANAQEIRKNAIGLRMGDNDGFGGEISYQRALTGNNRLEVDLGWRDNKNYDAFKVVGLYQWIWNIDGGFNWYAGVGAGLGSYAFKEGRWNDNYDRRGTFLVGAGNLGIEYVFDIPLMLSLDIRPELYFGDDFRNDNFGPDIALGIRYTF